MTALSNTKTILQLKSGYRQLNRLLATQTQLAEDPSSYQQQATLRPYSELPGPKFVELITSFMPGGKFYDKSITDFAAGMRQKYGNICLMRGIFGRPDMVLTFNPRDYEKIYRNEGLWPIREGFEQILHFREHVKKDFFGDNPGLIVSQYEAWLKLRSTVNPVMMKPSTMKQYIKPLTRVTEEFIKRVADIRDPQTQEVPASFDEELNRLAFESIALVALNKEFGLIRKNRDNPEALQFFENVRQFFKVMYELDVEPSMWKTIRTPKYYKSMRMQTEIFETSQKFVTEALELSEQKKRSGVAESTQSVLEKLIAIDRKVAIVMAMDLIMAGVDATSATLAAILLALAKHPEKQQKLRCEILKILPNKDSILTEQNMKNMPYMRAVIKETMRYYPNGPGTFRKNLVDLDLSGYKIPAGTNILLNLNVISKDEQYFPKANEFIPERWLRDADNKKVNMDPFTYMPFGFGARICLGKRFVDLELEVSLSMLLRNYYVEFDYSADDPFRAYLINVAKIPLKFKFIVVEY